MDAGRRRQLAVASAAPDWHGLARELDGSIIQNLASAVKSAERLKGHPVHEDTLVFWRALLAHSRAAKRSQPVNDMGTIETLMARLQSELTARDSTL